MVFTILNNSLMVDSWVFNAYRVHYGELLQRQTLCAHTVYIQSRNSVSL